jgi:hypothetical protein
MASERDDRRAIQHMSDWLSPKLIGCRFARYLSIEERLLFAAVRGDATPAARQLQNIVVAGSTQSMPVVAVLPEIDSQSRVASLLIALSRLSSWHCRIIANRACPDLIVGLEWQTPSGQVSRVQGLGPFPTMPSVRRSPYVALVLWPGAHENRFWESNRRSVTLADTKMPEELDQESYDRLWRESSESTGEILTSHHVTIRSSLRSATFILNQSVRPLLAGLKVQGQIALFDDET